MKGDETQGNPDLDEARVRDIMRVLTRLWIETSQLTLYHLALAAGEKGVKSSKVKKVLGLDQAQHRGVMSVLAQRVNNTPRELFQHDKPGKDFLFDAAWKGNQMVYRARPELVEAIHRLPELDALLRSDTKAVLKTRALHPKLPKGIDPNPPIKAQPKAEPPKGPSSPFSEVLDALFEDGLHFPSELVANFVLALQTKRFAILTGISGTGKTRIAQALAGRYARPTRSVRPVEVDDPRAVVLTVKPYMRKYARFIVPKDLAMQWPLLVNVVGGGEKVPVRWGDQEHMCAIYGGEATALMLTGPARLWFLANLELGAPFVARLEGPEEQPEAIRLELIEQQVIEDPKPENYEVVAVRPDWTDSRGLLGYFNPITERYVTTPFLRLLLRADLENTRAIEEKREPEPFFLVLDEMNLARVEHYFSDFLSAMESGEPIALHDVEALESGEGDVEALAVPKDVTVPPNLYFVGTVNVDESTYMFSPKVLDRAFTIELNEVHLRTFGQRPEWSDELDLTRWDGRLDPEATRKPLREDWVRFAGLEKGALRDHLIALHDRLADEHRHFGYRVANEVARFVCLAVDQAKDAEQGGWVALDLAILEKVLVKLHGTQQEVSSLLRDLLLFCLVGPKEVESGEIERWTSAPRTGDLSRAGDDEEADRITPVFPRSARKLWRMRRRLGQQGFTAWIE